MRETKSLGDPFPCLGPSLAKRWALPISETDVFRLCASVLRTSVGYSTVVDDSPPHRLNTAAAQRAMQLSQSGAKWRLASEV
jgi:hypothetical protein